MRRLAIVFGFTGLLISLTGACSESGEPGSPSVAGSGGTAGASSGGSAGKGSNPDQGGVGGEMSNGGTPSTDGGNGGSGDESIEGGAGGEPHHHGAGAGAGGEPSTGGAGGEPHHHGGSPAAGAGGNNDAGAAGAGAGAAGAAGTAGAGGSGSNCLPEGTITVTAGAGYIIDGQTDPTLTLCRGNVYTFAVNAPNHPFYIKTVFGDTTDNQYPNVTGEGAETGNVVLTVAIDAPDTLFYNCSAHSTFGGTLIIVD